MFNPFPGLRPFEPDEDHLFFGREKEIDELLRRLRVCRFLSIVGTSGSGKSSLVRSGLLPALDGGFMVQTNPDWRVAIMRPGEDPLRHLAEALNSPEILGTTGELQATNSVLLEATLRRGTRGLVEAVRQARIPHDNLLIVVDQFEELFRFRRNVQVENSRDEASSFVKLLLEAAQQEELPIYIVITMRSDFIGDCMDFPGLPEIVNAGLYLVPRMTRDELRSAITGPVAVGGGNITQRLVLRLLNDFGDEYDQLPILQHALMRTWNYWEHRSPSTDAIDIEDYEAIGTFKRALSIHAEEAFDEAGSDTDKKLAEKIFKALTDTFSDPRGTRRPTALGDLTAICESSQQDVIRVIELFRRPGRSFLMPPADVPLDARCIIDLSHESLMRCWTRLVAWADQEKISADIYTRLSDASLWYEEGMAGLWRNPELEVGQKWKLENHPNGAWAQRYNSSFASVMKFLDESEAERQRESAEKKRERQKKLRQTQWAAGILGSLFLISLFLAYYAFRQTRRAESNLALAKRAVDESLSSAGRETAREEGDMPQFEQFRKELLDKAAAFYTLFSMQNATDPALRAEEARAHSRLGDIDRLMGRHRQAIKEYNDAIERFTTLSNDYPNKPEFRQALAYCYNWLGETLRDALDKNPNYTGTSRADTDSKYTKAIDLQEQLHKEQPANATYQQELARTYYNRGINRYQTGDMNAVQSDFRKAIDLLEPIVPATGTQSDTTTDSDPAQDLARVYNNFAIVAIRTERPVEAKSYYEKAIDLAEQLVKKRPENREYKVELAQYLSNEARMLADSNESWIAAQRSQRALELVQDLAAPAPSLAAKMIQAMQLRGELLTPQNPREAKQLTDEALDALQRLNRTSRHDEAFFHTMYMNVGANYLELAQNDLERGDTINARQDLVNLDSIMPHLSAGDQQTLAASYQDLQNKLSRASNKH